MDVPSIHQNDGSKIVPEYFFALAIFQNFPINQDEKRISKFFLEVDILWKAKRPQKSGINIDKEPIEKVDLNEVRSRSDVLLSTQSVYHTPRVFGQWGDPRIQQQSPLNGELIDLPKSDSLDPAKQ